MNDQRKPGNPGRRGTDRQQSQHEENKELLNEIAGDLRSLSERYDGTIDVFNEKFELLFRKMDQAVTAQNELKLLEARVKTLEDAKISFGRMSWAVVMAIITLSIEAVLRAFHK